MELKIKVESSYNNDDVQNSMFLPDDFMTVPSTGPQTNVDDPNINTLMIRQDLSQNKIPQTPKNEISLIMMTDQLISYLDQILKLKGFSDVSPYKSPTLIKEEPVISKQPSFLTKAKDMLLTNTFKVENKLDEVSYCKYLASQHIIFFNQDPFFVDLFIQQMNIMKLKVDQMQEMPSWYMKYSKILVDQLNNLVTPLKIIQKEEDLLQTYCQSQEMLMLYTCILFSVRFLQGNSWGYSELFMHQHLDQEIVQGIKVSMNLLIMIWQNFRENQHLNNCLNEKDVISCYSPRESFLMMQGQEDMQSLIEGKKMYHDSHYLSNQVFKKTYIQAKRSIDDWLRLKNLKKNVIGKDCLDNSQVASSRDIISMQELIQYKLQYKSFTKNQIRSLKRPMQFPSKKQNKAQMTAHYSYSSVNLTYEQDGRLSFEVLPPLDRSMTCLYEIENSRQILVITGQSHEELRIVIESFLQANLKIRTKYKCCVLHHCTQENSLSCDSYFIVKNIMRQIIRTLPFVKDYLLISGQNKNEFSQVIEEMMGNGAGESYLTQNNFPQIFVKFIKRLNELKLDFNIVVAITGIEFAFAQHDLSNIVYLLRSASVYLHTNSFFKFILTTLQPSSDPLLKILQTGAICHISDSLYFTKNSLELAEFALEYLCQVKDAEMVERMRERAKGSYYQLVKIIHQMIDNQESFEEFKTEEEKYTEAMQKGKRGVLMAMVVVQKVHMGDNAIQVNELKRCLKGINEGEGQMMEFMRQLKFLDEDEKPMELQGLLEQLNPVLVCHTSSKASRFHQEYNCSISQSRSDLSDYLDKQWSTLDTKIVQLKDVNLLKETIIKMLNNVELYHHLSWITNCLSIQDSKNMEWVLDTMMKFSPSDQNFDHLKNLHSLDFVQLFNNQIRLNQLMEKKEITLFEIDQNFLENFYESHVIKMQILLRPDVIFFMIKYVFKSFWRYIKTLKNYARSFENCLDCNPKYHQHMELIFEFINILQNIELTLSQLSLNKEEIFYSDFLTQFRCRVLKEQSYLSLLGIGTEQDLDDFLREYATSLGNGNSIYFQGFHHSLRENKRLEMIVKMPGCLVLAVKFFCKNLIFISLSNGLILQYDTESHKVLKIFPNKGAIIDCLKILSKNYLITAGIDSKTRMWSIKQEKLFAKFEIHKYATQQILINETSLYSYGGHDLKLAKLEISTKEIDCWINLKSHITSLKLIKSNQRIAAAFHDFDVVLYDLDLNQLVQITLPNMIPGDEVIKIIRTGLEEIMCFSIEGNINTLGCKNLEDVKTCSLFNLKNEDFIDLLLIKSRDQIIFTIESQKIEFYSTQSFKRTDSWDFFIQNSIICCHKNKEGSKILIADKSQNLIMFNFIKLLDTAKEKQVPSNRKYDPVVSIDITCSKKKKENEHQIISCSHDRDLRIWSKKDGIFVKKYDLSSFLADNVQCIKLGKNEENLFLGSKDMNVYLININKGKLCVVYEGHWNRVTNIYSVPESDILVTISESNIKVWDLEYDECIKNMNEHSSMIVYIQQTEEDEQQVMTIGDQFELKIWNYVTGKISKQNFIDLEKDQKDLRNLQILCCDVLKDFAYIAINNFEILIYSIYQNKTIITFSAWQEEEVIFLKGIKTFENNFLLVVYRSACFLYQVHLDSVERICSYVLNSRKNPQYKQTKQYSNNLRYYFTSASVQLLFDHDLIGKYAELTTKLEKTSSSDPILRCLQNLRKTGVSTVEDLIQENKEEEIFSKQNSNPSEIEPVVSQVQSGTEMSYHIGAKMVKKPFLLKDMSGKEEMLSNSQEQMSAMNIITDKKIRRRREQQFKMQKESVQQKGVKHTIKSNLQTINSSQNEDFNKLVQYLLRVENHISTLTDPDKYLKSQKLTFFNYFLRASDPESRDLHMAFRVLVCLGDSKGQIHMNHLYLK